MAFGGKLVDRVAPPAIGRPFRWLLAASWSANLGDGIALAAGPLLIASQTQSPAAVAAATILQRLPWLAFGLGIGIVVDRVDRRLLVVAGDVFRLTVLALLSVSIVSGQVSIAVVLTAMFLLGLGEVLTDISADSIVPSVVPHEHLGIANARFVFAHRSLNQLIGPPVGAVLFAVGMFVPFAAQAGLLGLAAALVRQTAVPPVERGPRQSPRAELAEGVRWLWRHGAVRTLSITIFIFNLTFGAVLSVLVLYAIERVDLDETGFGLLLAASAVGGVLGALVYGWLERRFTLGGMMRVGLALETMTHGGLALTTTPWVAMAIMFVFGAQTSVWGTTARQVRQRAVPAELQGRVSSVYSLGLHGGLVLGGVFGAIVGSVGGVVAVFWFAFVGSAVFLAFIWRELPQIAHR